MENKNLEKKEKQSAWKIIFKILFILFAVIMIIWGLWMALCWGIFLFDPWGRGVALYSLLGGIALFVFWIFFTRRMDMILKSNNKFLKILSIILAIWTILFILNMFFGIFYF